ncbi:M35 family metallopeptidase [Roseomonas sp. HJA6]|uniref:M35 family metallopeptidase n=1 Tax=Roseomonas alba TaxID=2846776 RepID=A0ABS7ABK5_9PROT|nr:M35 family metallopeptidase [Neoroseomonas alba]MBW6399480.1 M35 family metallopeptidase [Neoroseomonas alba]
MRKTLSIAAALAMLMLAPLPLAAQGVKGAERQALSQAGQCTDEHRAAIRGGFADARRMVNASIASLTLEVEVIRPHLVRYFGSNPAGAIAKNFRAIAQGLDQREPRLVYECNRADACRGQTFAYVRWGGNAREVMGVCPAFFRAARSGQDSRGGIILHEMSHLALGTRDHAYQPARVQALAKDDPAAAQMNADSYEYFAEFLPR